VMFVSVIYKINAGKGFDEMRTEIYWINIESNSFSCY